MLKPKIVKSKYKIMFRNTMTSVSSIKPTKHEKLKKEYF